jgi:fido (protein-threonine AMPylation protein)
VLRSIVAASDQRDPPTVAMAQDWHRRLYDEVPLPVPYYAGEVRDSDDRFPELVGYEVSVGLLAGAASADVWTELANFERQAQVAVGRIDRAIPVGSKPTTPPQLSGVITFCAVMHGEWVRIHPFANGNGRTARLWANWAAVRYGLPPFVTIKPRPGSAAYQQASIASMSGDHSVAVAVFGALFRSALAD